ncbi:hypothetical protein GIB67_027384, partial [Kingdonia uniflora]
MFSYAVNGRCNLPAHLWLTGCKGEIQTQLQRLPGFDKWIIEKESDSYIEALQDEKENLVYLTVNSEIVLKELDPKSIYIIGGLVDRNRWKGITMKKAIDQGIKTAKLHIGSFLKMSSSQNCEDELAKLQREADKRESRHQQEIENVKASVNNTIQVEVKQLMQIAYKLQVSLFQIIISIVESQADHYAKIGTDNLFEQNTGCKSLLVLSGMFI